MPFAEFLAKARAVHGDTFEYDEGSYKGAAKKVRIKCSKHGWFKQAASDHTNKGAGCKKCALDYVAFLKRLTREEFIERATKAHNGKFDYSRVEYVNTSTPVIITCPKHGAFRQIPTQHMAGRGCKKCASIVTNKLNTIGVEERVAKLRAVYGDKFDYSLVDDRSLTQPLTLICPEHGPFKVKMHDWTGCTKCNTRAFREKAQRAFIEAATLAHNGFYSYDKVEYVRAFDAVIIGCPVHGDYLQVPVWHQTGSRCPKCAQNGTSRLEDEIFAFVASLEPAAVQGSMKLVEKGEIDIYCPGPQVAFEVNGLYWHSTGAPGRTKEWPKEHMPLKTSQCSELGIRLIHYYEDEWNYRQEQVKQHIRSCLGLLGAKVAARKCVVADVPIAEARAFLDAHHIQGATRVGSHPGRTAGLYSPEGALVAVMAFSPVVSRRGQAADPRHWELTRFASSVQVVGGASKLLAHFARANPQMELLVSYSDKRISQGNLYEKLGFAKAGTSPPDYTYVVKDKRVHKSNFTKARIRKKHPEVWSPDKTEWEMTSELGLHRIYNCGLDKWEKKYPVSAIIPPINP
jgi:hypothetical protein